MFFQGTAALRIFWYLNPILVRRIIWSQLLIPLLLLALTPSFSQKVYYPDPGPWEKKDPASVGMNPTRLKEAIEFAIGHESTAPRNLKEAFYESAFGREPFGYPIGPLKERGESTGLVIRKGYVVAEWGSPWRVDQTFSVAKSFLSTLAGLAVRDELIRDIHDQVHSYMAPVIPFNPSPNAGNKADELKSPDVIELFDTGHNRKITWNHLLRQTSDWEGTLWGKPDWADRPEGPASEWMTRPRNEPGTVYKYNDTRVNVLALALLNIWRKPLPVVLKEKVMDPIDASPTWRWTGYENSWIVLDGQAVQSVSGGSHWGGGMFITAYDQARFGYLTLRHGKWKDRQVIPESWIRQSRTPTPAKDTYGFMNYFLNTGKKLFPSAPETAFAHIGAGTNMIYVDEDNDLVIVARWIDYDAIDGFLGRVLQSIETR